MECYGRPKEASVAGEGGEGFVREAMWGHEYRAPEASVKTLAFTLSEMRSWGRFRADL